MQKFTATQDCVIAGRGVVRKGKVIELSPEAAAQPRRKGWIVPPAPDGGPETPAAPRPAPKRPRRRKD